MTIEENKKARIVNIFTWKCSKFWRKNWFDCPRNVAPHVSRYWSRMKGLRNLTYHYLGTIPIFRPLAFSIDILRSDEMCCVPLRSLGYQTIILKSSCCQAKCTITLSLEQVSTISFLWKWPNLTLFDINLFSFVEIGKCIQHE